jgi:hypothetical protein
MMYIDRIEGAHWVSSNASSSERYVWPCGACDVSGLDGAQQTDVDEWLVVILNRLSNGLCEHGPILVGEATRPLDFI